MSYMWLQRHAEVAQKLLLFVEDKVISLPDACAEMHAIKKSCAELIKEFEGGDAYIFGALMTTMEDSIDRWFAEYMTSVNIELADPMSQFLEKQGTDLVKAVRNLLQEMLQEILSKGFLLQRSRVVRVVVTATATNRVKVELYDVDDQVILFGYLCHGGGAGYKWQALPGRTLQTDFTLQYLNILLKMNKPHACMYMSASSLKSAED